MVSIINVSPPPSSFLLAVSPSLSPYISVCQCIPVFQSIPPLNLDVIKGGNTILEKKGPRLLQNAQFISLVLFFFAN